jgi:hypothetical protein
VVAVSVPAGEEAKRISFGATRLCGEDREDLAGGRVDL